MFDLSSAIRDANPLVSCDRIRHDTHEHHDGAPSTPLSSILSNPKQKLTAQFKRAITMIKQRGDGTNDSLSNSSPSTQIRNAERLVESNNITQIVEQMTVDVNETTLSTNITNLNPFVQSRSQNLEMGHQSNSTIVTIDSNSSRSTRQTNPTVQTVKQSLQQIHSTILQNIHQPSASTANTLGSTPISVASSTGEVTILETIL